MTTTQRVGFILVLLSLVLALLSLTACQTDPVRAKWNEVAEEARGMGLRVDPFDPQNPHDMTVHLVPPRAAFVTPETANRYARDLKEALGPMAKVTVKDDRGREVASTWP